MASNRPYRGVFPVAPTIFDDRGNLDLDGQRRCIDFMIDAGSQGVCILANFSEQFVLTDAERETRDARGARARRGPCSGDRHDDAFLLGDLRSAQPPGGGGGGRHGDGDAALSRRDLPRARDRASSSSSVSSPTPIGIPVMIQDAPVAGTPLSVDFLARMAQELANIRYFKIEVAGAANKLRSLIAAGGSVIEGPWDGEEAITLMADLDAGATGAMTGGGYPDGIRQIIDPFFAGRRDEAMAAYARWLPLINYENRQCGLLACKVLMKEGGVIASDAVRHPLQPLHPATRAGLIEIARSLDPVVLRWGR